MAWGAGEGMAWDISGGLCSLQERLVMEAGSAVLGDNKRDTVKVMLQIFLWKQCISETTWPPYSTLKSATSLKADSDSGFSHRLCYHYAEWYSGFGDKNENWGGVNQSCHFLCITRYRQSQALDTKAMLQLVKVLQVFRKPHHYKPKQPAMCN